jgi:hypothetical protein
MPNYGFKSIGIKTETYEELLRFSFDLAQKEQRRVTVNSAIDSLLEMYYQMISPKVQENQE